MKQQPIKYKRLGISMLSSVLVLIIAELYSHHVSYPVIISRLLIPLLRLIGFITLGLVAGQSIEFLGWTRQFAVVARPFFQFSNLGHRCSAAFTTAFLSGASANAMLFEFYNTGKISKRHLFLSNYINQFPAFFLHLPTTMFIVLPLTGRAGAVYFLLTFLATLLRTALSLGVGKLLLPPPLASNARSPIRGNSTQTEPFFLKIRNLGLKIGQTLPGRIVKILVWVLPIYTLVFALTLIGFFKTINTAVSSHIVLQFMPVESLSVIVLSFAAEFTSGFAAAGALLHAGVLSVKQTVMALLLGNILAFPIRALRHQLPRYMGIFSPALGLQLLLSGQLFRIASLILVGTIYYMVV